MFKKGDKVKIVANSSGHNMPIGMSMTIKSTNSGYCQVTENNLNFFAHDLEFIPITVDQLKSQMNKAETEFIQYKAKLAFLQETGDKVLEEHKFRQYTVRKIIQGEMSADEKAKQIEAIYGRAA